MDQPTGLSRRHLIGGVGAVGVATASGLTHASASDGGRRADPRDLPNPIKLTLSSFDFVPQASTALFFIGPEGGLHAAGGPLFTFAARVDVPVGATITGITVFIDAFGSHRELLFERRQFLPPAREVLVSHFTNDTTGPEAVGIPVTPTLVVAGFSYLVSVQLSAFAPVVYGAEVTYTIPPDPPFPDPPPPPGPPPDPVGLFVPFAGASPRIYDTRAGGLTKLAADEERVIPLGVASSVQAAVFNLTITETEGAGGFVACFPADITWPGNSSINWSGPGLNIANLVVSRVDGAGAIKIRGGNASTHVVIDVVGTFE